MLAAPSTPQRQLQPFLMSASPAGPSSQAGDDDDENGEDNVFRDMSFEEILEDLNARFLANLPEEEMTLVRLYWQAEQAHWFYEDYLRPLNPLLPSLSQRQFTHLIIASSPLYDGAGIDYDAVWEEYCAYKKMVPCCGGILINATNDKVLMVRGWKTNAGWCFPRGKINSEESEVACAIREVEEETGFDLSGRISANDFIKTQINAQEVTMFIVPNIDESTVFETQTRKEIGAIEWVPFHDLPTWSHKKGPKRTGGSGQKKFYNVTPFVGPLKKWLTNHGINPYPKRRVEAVPATRQRELQPFTFDDEPSLPATTSHASHAGHQHPTTALDHLFAKFIQKDESATNTESDNAKTLDQLFGGLMQQQPPKQQQTQQQQQAAAAQAEQASEDDALARLLGGLTTAAPPPPPPAQVLPDKQSKLLAVLSAPKNAPSAPVSAAAPAAPIPTVVQPQTPVRSYHQTNLLSMLSPPKPAASALAPAPVSPSGPPHTSVTAPPTDDDSERHNRQQALLQSLFMGPAAGPVTPPGAVTLRPQATASPASGMISPMPPMPPSQSGWQPPRPSMLSHQNGSPSRAPPQTPPQLGRTGPPAHLFTSPAPMHLSPQQVPRQPQAYPQSPPRPPVNNHQRALLGTLFNNTRPPMQGGFNSPPGPPTQGPPGMNIPPMNGMQGRPPNGPPPNGPYNQFAQFSGMPPPDQYSSQFFNPGYPPMGPGGPGGPGSHMPPPPPGMMRPPPGMPGPPGPGGPPGLSAPPQQQQQQPPQPQPSLQMPQPTIRQVSPAAAPPPAPAAAPAMPAHPAPQPQPLAPGAAVHQPVPRPPVGGGLLGLINGTT